MTLITRRHPNTMRSPITGLLDMFQTDPFFNFEIKPGEHEGNLALDVSEQDNHVIVRASLPGFSKEQVDVQVHDGVLTIKAEYDEQQETTEEKFYRRERRTGSMARSITLPGIGADADATAELADGVLTVRIPQAAEARPRKIAIN